MPKMNDLSSLRPASGKSRSSPTIYDIAAAVGLNASTVSRALSAQGRVKPATEARIRDAAAALGYRANPMARALPTGSTGSIGLILSDVTHGIYADVIRGAERAATSANRVLILAESQDSADHELELAERLLSYVDGLILVSSRLEPERIELLADGKPLVLINRHVEGVPSLVPDVVPGLTQAIDHLHEIGHRSIGYLSGPSAWWMNTLRWNTVFSLAVEREMSVVLLGPGSPSMDGGAGLLRLVMASGVSAIVAFNDLMALGLMRASQEEGIVIPDRLSIIGFDDIFGADLTTPALTTIRSPLADLGGAAITLLAAAGHPQSALSDAATEFVRRDSTAPRLPPPSEETPASL